MKLYVNYQYASVSMSKDADFIEAVKKVFQQYPVQNIIESGTYMGTGSTVILANALKDAGRLSSFGQFYTLEVDFYLYNRAKKNLETHPFVKPVWGMSVTKEEALRFIQADDVLKDHTAYENIFIDDIADPVGFYTNEINGELSNVSLEEQKVVKLKLKLKRLVTTFHEGFFDKTIPAIKNEFPLFLLDSAGGIGWLEFQKVVQLMVDEEYILILDDTHHLKHFRSLQYIQQNKAFTILASNALHGWVIAHHRK